MSLPLLATPEHCSGRTFIVTGANTGLGYEATKHLVAGGAAKVIMAVRNTGSGQSAKAKIEEATGKTSIAEVWPLNMSSYDSVKAFSYKVSTELDRVDALIENAGVSDFSHVIAEGHYNTVTVNIISTFLLTVLMLPKLSQTAQKFRGATPHITIVGSNYGFMFEKGWASIRENPLKGLDTESDNYQEKYALTKLVDILLVRELGPQIPVSHTGVVVNVVCPGLCSTKLLRHYPVEMQNYVAENTKLYGRTAEQGSRSLLHGAVAGKETHGRFLESCKDAEANLPAWVTDAEGQKAQKLSWDQVATELEKIEPGCLEKVVVAN